MENEERQKKKDCLTILLADFVLSIIGISRNIKRKDLLFLARKCLSLAWSIQALSFSVSLLFLALQDKGMLPFSPLPNSILGMISSFLSFLNGLFMVLEYRRYRQNHIEKE